MAIAGRYVFTSAIFDCLDHTPRGVAGEIQLTDAMNQLAQEAPLYALNWKAKRYDIGNFPSYFESFVEFALADPDYGAEFRRVLERLLARSAATV